ncbi:hypothetical protein [Bacillus sp. JJ1609]
MPSLDMKKPGIATKGVYDSALYLAEAAAFLSCVEVDKYNRAIYILN